MDREGKERKEELKERVVEVSPLPPPGGFRRSRRLHGRPSPPPYYGGARRKRAPRQREGENTVHGVGEEEVFPKLGELADGSVEAGGTKVCNGEVDSNGHDHDDQEGDYDKVGSAGSGRRTSQSGGGVGGVADGGQAVSHFTQTDEHFEFDGVGARAIGAGRIPLRMNGACSNNNGSSNQRGILSSLLAMVLPTKRKQLADQLPTGMPGTLERNVRCISTQTEESPVSVRARELCCMVIQELALENPVASSERDEVFVALCFWVCKVLDKHSILFNGMLRRFDVSDFRVFTCIANELFGVSKATQEVKITWGRVVSLFAFAVRLAQKHKEAHEEDKLDNVVQYLSTYISKHLLDFVAGDGGWEGLVKEFPLPDSEEKQVKRALMWSGLCVGLVATMYVSSFLSK